MYKSFSRDVSLASKRAVWAEADRLIDPRVTEKMKGLSLTQACNLLHGQAPVTK